MKYKIFGLILFSTFYSLFSPSSARAATLYAGSAYQTVSEGETFVVDWFLDTEAEPLNTIFLKLKFSAATLEVVEANPGASLVSLWIQPPKFSNETGIIELTGGVPGGFNNDAFPVFRTVMRGKQPGMATVTMDGASAVLLHDGRGTQTNLKFQVLNFVISPRGVKPAEITSTTHPNQDQWYRNNSASVRFSPRPGEQYSYSFSSNLEIFPDEIAEEETELTYRDLPDGIYYFKLNSRSGQGNWQEAGIYRVQIDRTPPEIFTPLVDSDSAIFGGEKFISFSTVDKTSGISHYEIKNGLLSGYQETQTPFKLKKSLVGDYVAVKAVDAAGNVRTAKVDLPGYLKVWQFALLLGVLVLGTVLYIWRKKKSK